MTWILLKINFSYTFLTLGSFGKDIQVAAGATHNQEQHKISHIVILSLAFLLFRNYSIYNTVSVIKKSVISKDQVKLISSWIVLLIIQLIHWKRRKVINVKHERVKLDVSRGCSGLPYCPIMTPVRQLMCPIRVKHRQTASSLSLWKLADMR